MIQPSVSRLLTVAPQLTGEVGQPTLDVAVKLLDELTHPLSAEDIEALFKILPADGDDAWGLNWTILHAIEASPEWPIWRLLEDDDHDWVATFRVRLRNGGLLPPEQ